MTSFVRQSAIWFDPSLHWPGGLAGLPQPEGSYPL